MEKGQICAQSINKTEGWKIILKVLSLQNESKMIHFTCALHFLKLFMFSSG